MIQDSKLIKCKGCGKYLSEMEQYCSSCGTAQKEEKPKEPRKPVIIRINFVTAVLVMVFHLIAFVSSILFGIGSTFLDQPGYPLGTAVTFSVFIVFTIAIYAILAASIRRESSPQFIGFQEGSLTLLIVAVICIIFTAIPGITILVNAMCTWFFGMSFLTTIPWSMLIAPAISAGLSASMSYLWAEKFTDY